MVAGNWTNPGYVDGPAHLAKFHCPTSTAYWSADTSVVESIAVIVADYHNHCLRFFDLNTRTVSTLAGECTKKGSATDASLVDGGPLFNFPSHVAVVNNSRLIVADIGNGCLRAASLAGGALVPSASNWTVFGGIDRCENKTPRAFPKLDTDGALSSRATFYQVRSSQVGARPRGTSGANGRTTAPA